MEFGVYKVFLIGMIFIAQPSPYPTHLGEYIGVLEVDGGVEVEVGARRHVVPGEGQVLLAVPGGGG